VAGDHERDDLVAHLLRRQRDAVVAVRGEQQVEQVARRRTVGQRVRGAVVQHRVDRGVETPYRTTQHHVGRRRHRDRHGQRRSRLLHHDVERGESGVGQLLGVVGQVAAEQRRAHDLERGAHHRGVDVDDRPVVRRPAGQQPVDGTAHVVGDQVETGTVERGLHERPLHAPGLGVGSEEPLAGDQRERGVLRRALAVGAGVGDQHPAYGLDVAHEVGGRLRDRELQHRAVLGAHGGEERERVAADRADRPEHHAARRPRRRHRRRTSQRHARILHRRLCSARARPRAEHTATGQRRASCSTSSAKDLRTSSVTDGRAASIAAR